jgi:hypothetical protein
MSAVAPMLPLASYRVIRGLILVEGAQRAPRVAATLFGIERDGSVAGSARARILNG